MSADEVMRYHAILVSELNETHIGRQFYIFEKGTLRSPIFRFTGMVRADESMYEMHRDEGGSFVGFQFQSGRFSEMNLPRDKEVFVYFPIADLPDSIPTPVAEGWL